jgi:hypothetical protein
VKGRALLLAFALFACDLHDRDPKFLLETKPVYLCAFFCNRKHNPVTVPFAVSHDGRRVATGGRLGAGLWDTDADTLIAPLSDPLRAPLAKR